MVDRLAATRFLAVLGASGSGKSSLVMTGLLDALEIGLHVRAGSRWRIAHMRPGSRPTANLARVLLCSADGQRLPSDLDIELLSSYLQRGPRSVAEWCKDGNLPAGTNLLILVDQFEELFRYSDYAGREEAEAFVALLLESARAADAAVHVTITMRSEYLGACALIPGLAEQINAGLYLAPRMSREEVRAAIEGPAAVCGFSLEPALVNRLLNDLSSLAPWEDDRSSDQLQRLSRRADQLPLMQHVLNRMWLRATEKADHNPIRLRLADYERVGGLTGALDAHAREVFDGLREQDRSIVEAVFRALISGTSVANAVRRPCRFDELVAIAGGDVVAVTRVVDAFRAPDCNFLTPSVQVSLDNSTIVDISHESLIRQWSLLSDWLDKEARAAALWRRLVTAMESHSRREGGLPGGLDLANFRAWWDREVPNPAWAMRYGGSFEAVSHFLDESRAAEDERLAREHAREQRDRRRLQYGAVVCMAFAIVASIFLYLAQQSESRFKQAYLDLQLAVKKSDKSLAEAQGILNAVTQVVGREEYQARIGAEKFQKDLLTELAPRAAQLAAMRSAESGMSHDEIEALFELGRLTSRMQSKEEALKILLPPFKQLQRQYNGHANTDKGILDFVTLGYVISQAYQELGQTDEAHKIESILSRFVPGPTDGLEQLSTSMLEAYSYYLEIVRWFEPWSAENEWQRTLVQRRVAVADRFVEMASERPKSHYMRAFSYEKWATTLANLGRRNESEAAIKTEMAEAKAAYDLAPQNSIFLIDYTRFLSDYAGSLLSKGALEDSQQTAQQAADLLRPALEIAPDSASLLEAASKVFDQLGNILQYKRNLGIKGTSATHWRANSMPLSLLSVKWKPIRRTGRSQMMR
jgi:hypothetical protein